MEKSNYYIKKVGFFCKNVDWERSFNYLFKSVEFLYDLKETNEELLQFKKIQEIKEKKKRFQEKGYETVLLDSKEEDYKLKLNNLTEKGYSAVATTEELIWTATVGLVLLAKIPNNKEKQNENN